MQIRPIRSDADHTAAILRIEALMGAEFGSPEGDELDVLATLVSAYEKDHYRFGYPEPISAIEFRMEQQNLTRRDLEPLIGSRARVSEVLSGKRSLTLPMIRRLSAALEIPVDVLVGIGPNKSPLQPRKIVTPSRQGRRQAPNRKTDSPVRRSRAA